VRLKDPEKVAQFVMEGSEGWTPESLDKLIGAQTTKDIAITNSFPVYVLYYTAWVNDKGAIVYGSDIYGEDKKLIELLKKIDGIYIPGNSEVSDAQSVSSRRMSIQ
jgi:murein L,D-transpeptidase YcbB/YkuD